MKYINFQTFVRDKGTVEEMRVNQLEAEWCLVVMMMEKWIANENR